MARTASGWRQAEHVAVAAQVARMVGEPLAAEVRLAEAVPLEHRAHRPIEHDDPLGEQVRQASGPRSPG